MQNSLTCVGGLSEVDATLIATIAALALGLLGYLDSKRRHKKEYTLQMFSPLLTDEQLARAHHLISERIIQNSKLNYESMTEVEIGLVLRILGYYEFLCSAIKQQHISRETILQQRSKNSFKSFYDISENFIQRRRELLRCPSVYSDFEEFVQKHCQEFPT